jgi:hypothetical protein
MCRKNNRIIPCPLFKVTNIAQGMLINDAQFIFPFTSDTGEVN